MILCKSMTVKFSDADSDRIRPQILTNTSGLRAVLLLQLGQNLR